jgi:hypothetical protein
LRARDVRDLLTSVRRIACRAAFFADFVLAMSRVPSSECWSHCRGTREPRTPGAGGIRKEFAARSPWARTVDGGDPINSGRDRVNGAPS